MTQKICQPIFLVLLFNHFLYTSKSERNSCSFKSVYYLRNASYHIISIIHRNTLIILDPSQMIPGKFHDSSIVHFFILKFSTLTTSRHLSPVSAALFYLLTYLGPGRGDKTGPPPILLLSSPDDLTDTRWQHMSIRKVVVISLKPSRA